MSQFSRPGHEFYRNSSGSGETQMSQAACSCGWAGTKYEAWQDTREELIKIEERQHYADIIGAEERTERIKEMQKLPGAPDLSMFIPQRVLTKAEIEYGRSLDVAAIRRETEEHKRVQ